MGTPSIRTFPLVPKSTRWLQPGDFWAVPLPGGRFACGRVLQVEGDRIPVPARGFFGGVLNWLGDAPPTSEAIAGHKVLEHGVMHIRAITRTGGAILGHRNLALDDIESPVLLSAVGGPDVKLLTGARTIRSARPDELRKYPVLGCWGYLHIQDLAAYRLLEEASPD